jgi:membrane protein implicated in regulation of membrane protease activity
MSKRKQHKQERDAVEKARQLTAGKIIRLVLKSLVFAMLVAALIVGLSLLGVPWLMNTWAQLAIMIVVYLFAYPYLMREFRPQMYLKRQKKD